MGTKMEIKTSLARKEVVLETISAFDMKYQNSVLEWKLLEASKSPKLPFYFSYVG